MWSNPQFHFEEVNIGEIKKEILKLDKTKASQKIYSIPTRMENIDIFAEFLCASTNSAIKSASFPSSLKLANVTLLHKIERTNMKGNYRSINILSTLSKIFEKCVSTFFDNFFFESTICSWKGYSTQYCLLVMLKTWKRSVVKGKVLVLY